MAFSGSAGKSKSNSQSGNLNNDALMSSMYPATSATSGATGLMGAMLNGGPNGYADSGGFNFLMNKGVDQVNSKFYSQGLGESGAAMKGMEDYRSGLADTYLNQYLDHVNQMGQLGIGAGSVLANSGDYSKAKSKSKNGSIGVGGGGGS